LDNPDFLSYLGLKPGERWPASMLYPRSVSRNANTPSPDPARLFGYNYTTLEGGFGVPNHSRRTKLVRIARPSHTIAFADAVDIQINFTAANTWRGEEEYLPHSIAYRHPYGQHNEDSSKQRAAVVRWDGSAAMITREEATTNQSLWRILED
jgi:hypothetical protein